MLAAVCPCSRSGCGWRYVVGRGVLDDLVVGQSHDAARLVPLGSTALDGHAGQRGVLSIVLRTARLRGHLVRVL